MINEKTFSDLLADIDLDEPNSNAYAATECFELSMKMSIDFAAWILNESFVPSFNSLGERSYKAAYNDSLNKSPEELFELYLTENK